MRGGRCPYVEMLMRIQDDMLYRQMLDSPLPELMPKGDSVRIFVNTPKGDSNKFWRLVRDAQRNHD